MNALTTVIVAATVILAFAADRMRGRISGGMQQQAAIGRVLANDPAVLLMDEPSAALDAQTRSMMQAYLLAVWSKLPKTIVFVTHDIDEALLLSDRIIVMGTQPGRIIADLANLLPWPRHADIAFDSHYLDLKRQCFELIRAGTLKSFELSADRQLQRYNPLELAAKRLARTGSSDNAKCVATVLMHQNALHFPGVLQGTARPSRRR